MFYWCDDFRDLVCKQVTTEIPSKQHSSSNGLSVDIISKTIQHRKQVNKPEINRPEIVVQ